jgi:hypothetical protein
MGEATVASCVVFGRKGGEVAVPPLLCDITGGDDYATMRPELDGATAIGPARPAFGSLLMAARAGCSGRSMCWRACIKACHGRRRQGGHARATMSLILGRSDRTL